MLDPEEKLRYMGTLVEVNHLVKAFGMYLVLTQTWFWCNSVPMNFNTVLHTPNWHKELHANLHFVQSNLYVSEQCVEKAVGSFQHR